jgi:two-component system sensor histidine kinase KdpD
MKKGRAPSFWPKVGGYVFAVSGVAAVTVVQSLFHERLSSTAVGLTLLLILLFAAMRWGSRPALLAALLGGVCFNFFLPPVYTFTIVNSQDWVAMAAFLITTMTVGELSARAKRRPKEAEAGRCEIERLCNDYRVAAERARRAGILEQSERLKSALLDAVTHDLRTPLISIKAAVTALLDETEVTLEDEARREFLELINEEADRLNHFVENMVELARIEAGAFNLRCRWSSVEEIVAMTRGHRLEVEIKSELLVDRGDASLIAEVLYSLIDIAAKYFPAGSRIKISARHAENEMILIAAEDQGRGLPAHLRERVFDKFFRATSEGAAGLGRREGRDWGWPSRVASSKRTADASARKARQVA